MNKPMFTIDTSSHFRCGYWSKRKESTPGRTRTGDTWIRNPLLYPYWATGVSEWLCYFTLDLSQISTGDLTLIQCWRFCKTRNAKRLKPSTGSNEWWNYVSSYPALVFFLIYSYSSLSEAVWYPHGRWRGLGMTGWISWRSFSIAQESTFCPCFFWSRHRTALGFFPDFLCFPDFSGLWFQR